VLLLQIYCKNRKKNTLKPVTVGPVRGQKNHAHMIFLPHKGSCYRNIYKPDVAISWYLFFCNYCKPVFASIRLWCQALKKAPQSTGLPKKVPGTFFKFTYLIMFSCLNLFL